MNKRLTETGAQPESAPMEQVRELLFGAQLKDMEIRSKRQEERFQREIHDAKDSFKKRLDSLENFMKSEITSLLNRVKEEQHERQETIKTEQRERSEALKAEQRERSEALKTEQRERAEALSQLSKDLAAMAESFDRKLAKLTRMLETTERELRQLLLSESGSLTDKIETKYDDALSVLSKTAAQIRSDMVYRTSLSSMLTEMVVKLSGQWSMDHDIGSESSYSENAYTAVDEPQAETE